MKFLKENMEDILGVLGALLVLGSPILIRILGMFIAGI